MAEEANVREGRFGVGQLVRHQHFGYRGVVVDVDATFQLTDEWYDEVARSRPPKDRPWYHVLVDQADHMTYVAERNLGADSSAEPVEHPWLGRFFDRFSGGRYHKSAPLN
jgi:heat shock protein HspQ